MDDEQQDGSVGIQPGAEVYGSDGERLGAIVEVSPDYLVVEKGVFFPTDYFVPISAVASAKPDRVTLTVGRDEALEQGWDREPGEQDDAPVPSATGVPHMSDDRDANSGEHHRRDGDPVTSGMASTLGTIPPAADFNTLGVAAIDVDDDYTEEGRPADESAPARDDPSDPEGRPA